MDEETRRLIDDILIEGQKKVPNRVRGKKSDVEAKGLFAERLRAGGLYESVSITRSPADITAIQAGLPHYFEIKVTDKQEQYFGAATLTEWEAALSNPERFKFVVACKNAESWTFSEYAPLEFMRYSYIPPFKIYFNVPIGDRKEASMKEETKRVCLTEENVCEMVEFYRKLKSTS